MSISYYSASLADFLLQSPMEILGELTRNHRHDLEHQQREAWLAQIDILKDQLAAFPEGVLHFELIIPRMGKRADCVVLTGGIEIHGERWKSHLCIRSCRTAASDWPEILGGNHSAGAARHPIFVVRFCRMGSERLPAHTNDRRGCTSALSKP